MNDVVDEGRTIETSVAEAGLIARISESEINQQIATAHRYPRSLKAFRDEGLQMVTLTEQIAQECIYALPRDGKTIEGPSARFAEIIAHAWGNNRAGARVVDDSGDFVTSQGVFLDLQKNSAITYEVQRRIVDKNGRRFKVDMIGVTANAASSIALRNAILKGVPKAFWNVLYQAARKTVMGDFKTLANRRADAITQFVAFGVNEAMLFEKLGIQGKDDIGLEHLVVLAGLLTALKDGDTTVEDTFAKPTAGVAMPQSKSAGTGQDKGEPAKPDQAATASTANPSQQTGATAATPANVAASAGVTGAASGKPDTDGVIDTTGKLLTESKKRILNARIESARITPEQIVKQFGKPLDQLLDSQFNAIEAWVREMLEASHG